VPRKQVRSDASACTLKAAPLESVVGSLKAGHQDHAGRHLVAAWIRAEIRGGPPSMVTYMIRARHGAFGHLWKNWLEDHPPARGERRACIGQGLGLSGGVCVEGRYGVAGGPDALVGAAGPKFTPRLTTRAFWAGVGGHHRASYQKPTQAG